MSATQDSLSKLKEVNDKLTILATNEETNCQEIVTLIQSLQTIPTTPSELKASQLNVIMNTFRKSQHETIASATKSVISYWKSTSTPTPTASTNSSTSSESSTTTTTTTNTSIEPNPKLDPETLVQIAPAQPLTLPTKTNSTTLTDEDKSTPINKRPLKDVFIMAQTGSKSRDQIQKLFYGVFDLETVDTSLRCELAITIEQAIFQHFMSENQEYKDRCRMLLANLKDPKNADFRESIIDGYVEPKQLPTISQTDMASKAVRDRLQADADYQLQARKTDLGGGEGVDMFPCPKCKGRNTSFFQKQTRSADEPMTIFCTCLLCRHKWRIY